MNETLKGGIVGGTTVFVGYPLDTIKTYKQNKQILQYSIRNLYRGMSAPLAFSIVFNSSLFSLHEVFYKKTYNHFYSGFIAGFISAPIISIVELYKIKKQLNHTNFNIKDIIKFEKPLLGCSASMARESIASAFYFGSYYYLRDKDYHPAFSGGIAGCASWLFSYQIDTIKTRIQSGSSTTYIDAIKKGGLNKGISYCLGRALLVNSIGFYIYDIL